MGDELKRGEPDIGHSSTTAPGGEKDLTRNPGRSRGKAEGAKENVEEPRGPGDIGGEKAK